MKRSTLTGIFVLIFIQVACSQQTGWQESLDKYLAFRNSIERFSGTVLIAKDGKKIYSQSIGFADRTWDIPVNDSTRYDLASVTKMFTSVSIAQLLEEGKLELDDTINEHFPGFPENEIGASTTIRQLLSHTSGISDFFMQSEYLHTDRYRLRELADYDRFYALISRNNEWVGEMHYSNTNFMILGRIIEKISGESFYKFVADNIFAPLNMQHTGFFEHDRIVKNVAKNYTRDSQAAAEFGVPSDDRWRSNSYMRAVKGMAAGGAISTAGDLLKFFNGLRNNKLINRGTYNRFTKPDGDGYALGFQGFSMEGMSLVGHSGGFYGVSVQAFYLPEQDYSIIVLSNTDFGAMPVFDRFIRLFAGQQVYNPIDLSQEALRHLAGAFEITEGQMSGKQLTIKAKDGYLLFDNELEFYPYAEDKFFDIDNESFRLHFEKGEGGKIVGFQWFDGQNFNALAKVIDDKELVKLESLSLSDDELEQYLGSYKFGSEGMMPGHQPNLEIDEGAILIDGMMRFVPYEKDKFFLKDDVQMQLNFNRDESGTITGFDVKRGDRVVGRVEKLK